MNYFLGIDLGTSYFKAGIFDEKGSLQGLGRYVVNKNEGNGNLREVPTDRFWDILSLCIEQAISNSRITADQIIALAYASQANSFILLDKEEKPLTPLILWSDNRVDELSQPLRDLINRDDFITKSGQGIKPGTQSLAAKVDWFQMYRPRVWEKVDKIMSISDYLIFSLTGRFVTDTSTSSMTGLLNVQEGGWWQDAIKYLNIKTDSLPLPLSIGTFVAPLMREGAKRIGLTPGTRLFTGGLDHHMVGIGAGILNSNNISESTGTVLACVNYTNRYQPREGVNIARGINDNHFFQMTFNSNGASSLEWYQQNYARESTIPELLNLAEKIEPGSGGLLARPCVREFRGLEGFINQSEMHTREYFTRAILESTALSLSEMVRILVGNQPNGSLVPSGGGARSRLWLQIKSNILEKTFMIPGSVELACKGAAMLCLVGTSYFANPEEATVNLVKFKEKLEPEPGAVDKYKKWHNNVKKYLV